MEVMLKILLAALLWFQQTVTNPPQPPTSTSEDDDVEFICPMDKNVREKNPGKCRICGMTLVPNLPDAHEYPIHITSKPAHIKPGEEALLNFRVEDPTTGKTVQDFTVMHEKLYHFFLVSQDLQFFRHIHPEKQPDGTFNLGVKFPHAGLYRMLSDLYPTGGTPQLVPDTIMIPGPGFKLEPAKLAPDMSPKTTENLEVELVTEPKEPLAGFKTMMFFRLKPNDGIEPYLGAMGHMLAASSDLIDLMHTHPLYVTDPEDGAVKQIQFNLIFPRAGVYRVWTQFQRKGVVNTVVFDVPVKNLE
jgi:hypothetical protein